MIAMKKGLPVGGPSPKIMEVSHMVSATVNVVNPQGFHMRPANLFAQAMGRFQSDVTLRRGDQEVDGKSIMNLMAACIKQGNALTVACTGADEEAALAAALELIRSELGDL